MSDLNQKIYGKIEEWRQQPLVGRVSLRYPRRPVAEEIMGRRGEERLGAGRDRSVADRVSRGPRGGRGGAKEDRASWTNFLREMKQRAT